MVEENPTDKSNLRLSESSRELAAASAQWPCCSQALEIVPTDWRRRDPMGPWFVAREPFGPDSGGRWQSYLAWSGLTQLDELVSLDLSLCPDAVGAPDEAYWDHRPGTELVLSGYLVVNLPFLLTRLPNDLTANVLGLFLEQEARPMSETCELDFKFLGYDLVEDNTGTSALTNCGGFPDAFENAELTAKGLLATWRRAQEVQRDLRRHYPEEPHAHCSIWGIHRASWPPL